MLVLKTKDKQKDFFNISIDERAPAPPHPHKCGIIFHMKIVSFVMQNKISPISYAAIVSNGMEIS